MTEVKQKPTNKIPFIVSLILLYVIFCMPATLYAGYIVRTEVFEDAGVAAFQVENQMIWKETCELDPFLTGAEEQNIKVVINNDSETDVCYLFELETDGNLPLLIKGTDSNGTILTRIPGENTWLVDKAAGAQSEEYIFTVSLNPDDENYQYAGGVSSIRLTVTEEQKD